MSFSRDIIIKKTCITFLFTIVLLFDVTNRITASQGIASTGIWNNASTWTIGGVSRTPGCGDTLIIPAGVIVTVNSMEDLAACSIPLFITVQGTFQFTNGNKLDLPCGSGVNVLPGGLLRKATPGGGNSTYINMCGCTSWKAGDGTVNGPNILGCFTLPVSFLLFTAEETENGVELHWVTASEKNNNYFSLQRSGDGENFMEIERVKGAGNSVLSTEYISHDYEPNENITYYRLKQTDFDGRYSYSDLIAIRFTGRKSNKIISCEVDHGKALDVLFYEVNDAVTLIKVYDTTGKVIYTAKNNSERGINHLKLNVPFTKSGYYFLNLANEWGVLTEKIVFEK